MSQIITAYDNNVEDMVKDWNNGPCQKNGGVSAATIKYRDNKNHQGDYCGLDWGHKKYRRNNIESTDTTGFWLDDDQTKSGNPCPQSQSAVFMGDQFNSMECTYEDVSAATLITMDVANTSSGLSASGKAVPVSILNQLTEAYCKGQPTRVNDIVNTSGKTCSQLFPTPASTPTPTPIPASTPGNTTQTHAPLVTPPATTYTDADQMAAVVLTPPPSAPSPSPSPSSAPSPSPSSAPSPSPSPSPSSSAPSSSAPSPPPDPNTTAIVGGILSSSMCMCVLIGGLMMMKK